jgi:hypothetical protein
MSKIEDASLTNLKWLESCLWQTSRLSEQWSEKLRILKFFHENPEVVGFTCRFTYQEPGEPVLGYVEHEFTEVRFTSPEEMATALMRKKGLTKVYSNSPAYIAQELCMYTILSPREYEDLNPESLLLEISIDRPEDLEQEFRKVYVDVIRHMCEFGKFGALFGVNYCEPAEYNR